jgi:hypothetical protein
MALEVIRTPDFMYSGTYFPQIAARLRQLARSWAPEITNEDQREIFIELERAFALMGHYNNVLMDMIANELFINTARLPESVKLLLELINYRILPAFPSRVDLLGELNRTYSTTVRLLETNRRFATRRSSDEAEIIFENLSALDTSARTDQITNAYVMLKEKTGVCHVSTVNPDYLIWDSGNDWVTADLHKVIEIDNSILGNNVEDVEIVELLDEDTPGVWRTARLSSSSFVSESGLNWTLRGPTVNRASDLVGGTPITDLQSCDVGDKFYFGSADVMWDRFDVVISSVILGMEAAWEFYDPNDTSINPTNVTVDSPSAGYIRFDLSTLLGITDYSGAHVRVMHVPTGFEVNAVSSWTGSANVLDVYGYLGQTVPSTEVGDYLIFCKWRNIDVIEDDTLSTGITWGQSGKITFNLPQSTDDNWTKFSIYDVSTSEEREGYYLRLRATKVDVGDGPRPSSLTITQGKQYVSVPVTQGLTVEDSPLGSSSGLASQEFTFTRKPFVFRSARIFVDEGGGDIEWEEVDTFLGSYSTSRHFRIDIRTDGSGVVQFGDGTSGKIPPIGTNNIRALYRIGADEDGNIGSNLLTVNRDGVGVFRSVTNPRAGIYWLEADWASIESLERVKKAGVAALRSMYRAVTPKDCETLAKAFISARTGIKPVARAKAYEEMFGPKTIGLIVVGQGGSALDYDTKQELSEFFNGGEDYDGVLLMNYEVVVVNYTPRLIGVWMEVEAREIITSALAKQVLSALLTPTTVESRVPSEYVWRFGQDVPLSRISTEIFNLSPGNVFNVTITTPSADILLTSNELPVFDPSSSNVYVYPPTFT